MIRQLTISIPESFYNTFMEFFKHIPEAKIVSEETFSIPDWHKEETLRRIQSAKPENFISWKKAKKQLRHKTGR